MAPDPKLTPQEGKRGSAGQGWRPLYYTLYLKYVVLITPHDLPATCSFLGVNSEKQNHFLNPVKTKRSVGYLSKVDGEDRHLGFKNLYPAIEKA